MYQAALISSSKQITEDFEKTDLWNRDFELVCITEDVQEAILKRPNVIICPAKSSVADGLALAAQAYAENWSTKIVLYGRRTYENVHLALDAHAWGYLSMPLDNTEVVHICIGLKQLFDKMEQSEESRKNDDVPLLREYFFYNLCQGSIADYNQAESTFRTLLPIENCTGIAITKLIISDFSDYLAGQWKYGKDALYTAVSNFVIKGDIDDFILPVYRDDKEMYFLTVTEAAKDLRQRILQNSASVKEQLRDILSMEVEIREPVLFSNLKELFDSAAAHPMLPVNKRLETPDRIAEPDTPEKESTVIGNAKEYINNCYNREIGLDDVAAFVQLSPAYFSRLFKQETGENFIDYLIKVRMEHGKRLLENTTYKTYEISQMVGYKKSKYFSKLFKKYSGYTATEYRSYMNKMKQKRVLDRM